MPEMKTLTVNGTTYEVVDGVLRDARGAADGIATLGADGKLLDAQIPGLDKLGAAPVGYGLGDAAAFLDGVDIDTVRLNGWYRLNSTCTNVPTTSDGVGSCSGALLEVTSGGGASYVREQIIHLGTAGQQGRKLRRFYNNANKTWQPWEWINPPMLIGTEYRTTERYNGKPVYAKLISGVAGPNAAEKAISHEISDIERVVSVSAEASDSVNGSYTWDVYLVQSDNTTILNVFATQTQIFLYASDDRTSATVYVTVKYRKTTDN